MSDFTTISYFLDTSNLDKLKQELQHTANVIAGERSFLAIDKSIQTVELQISKSGSRRIKEADYYKRKRDPKVWVEARHGDLQLVDIFEEAKKHAEKEAKKATSNDDAKKKFISIHGNCVGVSGQAGIGKTTLTKQLVDKVLKKELFDISFLFYVSLKKVIYDERMNVLKFLLTNLESNWEHDHTSDKEILKRVEESEKVMIIFDGLDEATIELEKRCPNATLYDVATPDVILKNILNGSILRKAKKLITSRPRQMWELWHECRPHCIVNVLGINREAQRQICKNICEDDSEKVMESLLSQPELVAQCYVPIICIFTVYWLHKNMHHPDETNLFPSVTNIILKVLETFDEHDIARSEFELEKLSKLAWEGLSHRKYEFSENEIHKFNLKKESLNTVLTTDTKKNTKICILHVEKITYFSHLILQEFFSAICLILFLPFEEFKQALSPNNKRFNKQTITTNENLDVVRNFIFGLCNAATFRRLINLQPKLSLDNSNVDKKKLHLEKFVSKLVKDRRSFKFHKYLKICSMLYEMQDQKVTKNIVELFPEELEIYNKENIFPHDVSCLFYVLQERHNLLDLILYEPTFVGNSFERFLKKFKGMPECIKVSTVDSA